MIIRKIPRGARAPVASGEGPTLPKSRPVHMWERVTWRGKTFNVPLDEQMIPMGDLAIEDVGDVDSDLLSRSVQFAPEPPGPIALTETQRIIVNFVRQMLEKNGDATTYQVYEAVILRLQDSDLLGDDESVDLLMLLSSFFRHYEHKGERGELLRKWTAREPSVADTEQLARSAFEDWNWYVRGNMN
ncbi:MAG: hypothetical protein IIC80_10675 [Chloroflexi bacterium]|nr:hypothetical protein [Chloroflexota bacterium]